MFLKGDWVTIPQGYSAESEQMMEGDRVVGILTELLDIDEMSENGNVVVRRVPGAVVDVVDNQAGFTLNTIVLPVDQVAFVKRRESVPPLRLNTYMPHWIPRGVRIGLA